MLPQYRTLPFSADAGIPLLQDNRKDPATKGLAKLVGKLVSEFKLSSRQENPSKG